MGKSFRQTRQKRSRTNNKTKIKRRRVGVKRRTRRGGMFRVGRLASIATRSPYNVGRFVPFIQQNITEAENKKVGSYIKKITEATNKKKLEETAGDLTPEKLKAVGPLQIGSSLLKASAEGSLKPFEQIRVVSMLATGNALFTQFLSQFSETYGSTFLAPTATLGAYSLALMYGHAIQKGLVITEEGMKKIYPDGIDPTPNLRHLIPGLSIAYIASAIIAAMKIISCYLDGTITSDNPGEEFLAFANTMSMAFVNDTTISPDDIGRLVQDA